MTPAYIDSHAHLFFNDFRHDLSEVIDRARKAGVRAIIVPGTDLKTSEQALQLAERYPEIYAAVGFHPHDAQKYQSNDSYELEKLSHHPKVVAIGEIGLDFYYNYSPWDVQKKVFWEQMEIAASRNHPVIVHTRDSMPDTIDLVEKFTDQNSQWCKFENTYHRGVFHCFSGTSKDARTLYAMGFYSSFTGNVTFKKSTAALVVQELGFERMLLETDAPYMAPVPYRGKRNEPSYIQIIASFIADLCNQPLEVLAKKTFDTTCTLFRLKV